MPFSVLQDTNAAGTTAYTTANVAGSWNLGFATLMAQFSQQKNEVPPVADQKERLWLVGAVAPLGQGEIHASLARSDASGGGPGFSSADANQIALGYVYHLSKRTALYATGSRIDNKGSQAFSTANGTSRPGGPTAGGKSIGFEGGIRHSF